MTNEALTSKERTLHDDAKRLAEAGWPMSAVRVKEAAGEIERLRAALEKGRDYLQGEFYAEALGILDDALSDDSSAPETSVPLSPSMPKRERPQKTPDKSGVQYLRELSRYCGLRWEFYGTSLPPCRELENLFEKLADAQDDALRLHHAYFNLKYPQGSTQETKPDWRCPRCGSQELLTSPFGGCRCGWNGLTSVSNPRAAEGDV